MKSANIPIYENFSNRNHQHKKYSGLLKFVGQSPVGDYRPVLQKESGSTIQSVSSVNIVNDHVDNKTHAKNVTKLSFEDYHNSWTKLATSQPRSSSSKQPIIDLMRVTPSQPGNDKYERYENEIGVEIERQLKEHNSLMYGKFPREKEKHAERMRELKATKVQLLKDLHYNKRRQNGRSFLWEGSDYVI